MTYLQLVNAVLRRLREDQVTSYSQSDYSTLIGDFINETKREVEDSWNWMQLRSTIQIDTLGDSSTFRYTLTGAGNRAKILQVINDTQNWEMIEAGWSWLNKQFTMSGTHAQLGSPTHYGFNGSTDGDPNVDFWPVPSVVDTINFNLVLPQDDLSADGTVLTVPSWPVILGAHAKALSERGEDGGQSYAEVLSNYNKALSDAIALDAMNTPGELDWDVV